MAAYTLHSIPKASTLRLDRDGVPVGWFLPDMVAIVAHGVQAMETDTLRDVDGQYLVGTLKQLSPTLYQELGL